MLRAAYAAVFTAAVLLSTSACAGRWRPLYDGSSTTAWRGYQSQEMPTGWYVADGELKKDGPAGDIITKDEFADFDLQLDWKIGTGGNSGIFYRATESEPKVYWSGPEYQLLDDANAPDGHDRLTSAGADYALYPSPAGIVKPANEWNHTEIIVRGNHVEHWLNGQKLLSYELNSDDWKARVAKSKFAAWPNYGKASKGHIGIQGDHAAALALRNIKIRVLP